MFDMVEAFHRPGSIREALRLLDSGGGRSRIVAGGTDVIAQADDSIRFLIDITHAGLTYIHRQDQSLVIGATTTLAELEGSRIVQSLAEGILVRAAASSGSLQIRNRATLGGNLVNASPAADLATALLALDAEIVIADQRKRRKVPLAVLSSELCSTVMGKGLLVEVVIPAPPRRSRWSFQKLGRTEVDIALVNAAAGLQLDAKGKVKWVRLAFGAVAPTPIRAIFAETLLVGQTLDEQLLEQFCDQVALEVSPITDHRASAEYRRTMSRVLAMRAIQECAAPKGCTL